MNDMENKQFENRSTRQRSIGRHRIGAIVTLLICTACVLLMGPQSVLSNAPKDPSPSALSASDMRAGPRERRESRESRESSGFASAPGPMMPPPTTQERDDAADFFRAQMPVRMKFFD